MGIKPGGGSFSISLFDGPTIANAHCYSICLFSACAQQIISATCGNFKQCINVNLSFQHPPLLDMAKITLPETNKLKTLPSIEGSNNFHVFPLSDDLKMPSG